MGQFDYDAVDGKFMREMQQLYLENTAERIEAFRDAFSSLRLKPSDQDVIYEAYRLAHSLAGSAATYGFKFASEIGKRMEHALTPAYKEHQTLNGAVLGYLDALSGALNNYFDLVRNGDLNLTVPLPELVNASQSNSTE